MARFTPRGGVLLETRPSASRVRLRLLTRIRWVAVVGQAGGLLAGQYLFGITLPLLPAFLVVAVSTLLNLLIQRYRPSGLWLGDREAALYLGYDLLQLGVLLSLTGGLTNPFAILILAPITVSASLLSRSATLALSAMGLVAVSLLALVYIPLPWHQFGVEIQPLYLAGLWGSLVIAIVFIAAYVYSMSSEAQTLANALRAAELALEREQRLSAVGALAAAAAHELGTPLSTIALIAKELERGAPDEDSLEQDLALLQEESARCREILNRLVADPASDGGAPYHRIPAEALVELAAKPYLRDGVELEVRCLPPEGESAADQPGVRRSPALVQGLGMLLQNALQFAQEKVEATLSWDAGTLRLTLHDDGPGFDAARLEKLGQPYVGEGSRRRAARGEPEGRQESPHMGLGIFIAHALLARSGARLLFENHPAGGATVEITWDRATLDLQDEDQTAGLRSR